MAGLFLYNLWRKENVEKTPEIVTGTTPEPASKPHVETDSENRPSPQITLDEPSSVPNDAFKVPQLPSRDATKDNDNTGTLPAQKGKELPSLRAPEPPRTLNPAPPQAPPTLVRASSPPRLKPPTYSMAPPRLGNGSLRPPPSAAASLRVPPTKVLPNAAMAPTSSIMPPGRQVSRKVILEPGHSPLDWAALTSSPNSRLRGKDAPENLIRVTPSRLRTQNGRKGRDTWTSYQGKVYNITPYVPFHPGGAGEIMRGAGKDSTKLFAETHPWVNWDGMLAECLVGILVSEQEELEGNNDNKAGGLDEMD